MYRFVIEGKMHVGHTCQRIGRRAGKRDDRHADVFGDPRFIQHLLRFAAARNGNKYLIACGVAEKNIPAVPRSGDERGFSQHLQLLGQVLAKDMKTRRRRERSSLSGAAGWQTAGVCPG